MHVRSRVLWLQKSGNAQEEYEDAAWPCQALDRDLTTVRVAVADGATEASFSRQWARILTRAWCRGQLARGRAARELPRLQRQWRESVGAGPLPWYAEEKLRGGAFSSLLGLSMSSGGMPRRARWSAAAVGDSCLFQVSRDRLLLNFPITSSDQFTNSPALLSTDPRANGRLPAAWSFVTGRCEPGDTFFLLTDALASWFLRSAEGGEKPWRTLHAFVNEPTPQAFEPWIQHLREAKLMRNDDVTALCLTLR